MNSIPSLAERANPPAVLEMPPSHLELTWRPLTPGDVPALRALLAQIEIADLPAEPTWGWVERVVAGTDDSPGDSLGGFDSSGTLVGYGIATLVLGFSRVVTARLVGGLHPAWRGRGIGRALLNWQEGRARQLLAASDRELPAHLVVFADSQASDQRRLYVAAGFSPQRWYTTMRLQLPSTVAHAVDDGRSVTVRPFGGNLAECEALPGTGRVDSLAIDQWPLRVADLAAISRLAVADGHLVGYLLGVPRARSGLGVEGYAATVELTNSASRSAFGAMLASAAGHAQQTGSHWIDLELETDRQLQLVAQCEGLGLISRGRAIMYTVEL